jgi:hypothetical protein
MAIDILHEMLDCNVSTWSVGIDDNSVGRSPSGGGEPENRSLLSLARFQAIFLPYFHRKY